jgi:hypothetical protein
MLADALYRLRALFRRSDLERELDEELQLKAAARIACPTVGGNDWQQDQSGGYDDATFEFAKD